MSHKPDQLKRATDVDVEFNVEREAGKRRSTKKEERSAMLGARLGILPMLLLLDREYAEIWTGLRMRK